MKRAILNLMLFLGIPLTFFSALWLKFVLRAGVGKVGDNIFMMLGILPVPDQYYHPLINPKKHLKKSLRDDRKIKGIDLNEKEQLDLLARFSYNDELLSFPLYKVKNNEFFYYNDSYGSGDSEYLYNMIRHFKPDTIIEIGAGNSTLMMRNAIAFNKTQNSDYTCHHICIEPYEKDWLESLGVEVKRSKAETVDEAIYKKLKQNDILFIDSSHIIRPQGDVLFEYLELLPELNSGVIIHIHDVFTPKDYLDEWVYKHHLLWNEQYLMEAFLSFNKEFRIVGALNFLSHKYRKEFSAKCPVFATTEGREPGSFWMVKN